MEGTWKRVRRRISSDVEGGEWNLGSLDTEADAITSLHRDGHGRLLGQPNGSMADANPQAEQRATNGASQWIPAASGKRVDGKYNGTGENAEKKRLLLHRRGSAGGARVKALTGSSLALSMREWGREQRGRMAAAGWNLLPPTIQSTTRSTQCRNPFASFPCGSHPVKSHPSHRHLSSLWSAGVSTMMFLGASCLPMTATSGWERQPDVLRECLARCGTPRGRSSCRESPSAWPAQPQPRNCLTRDHPRGPPI